MKFLLLSLAVMFASSAAQATTRAVPEAFTPHLSVSAVWPVPQEETVLPSGFTLQPETTIYLAADAPSPALERAAQSLRQTVQERHGWIPRILQGGALPGQSILIGTNDSPFVQLELNRKGLTPVDEAEGYLLYSSPEGILIAGHDEAGVIHGLRTLRQLLEPEPTVRGVHIRDWPDLPWRVAMLYLDAHSDEVNLRLIPLLADYKYNAVLITTNYLQWQSAPELHVPGGATIDMARRVAQTAREHGLEPIPLLETLSHMEWFFENDQNRDLLPDPNIRSPYGYDPTNPRVYEVLLPLLDELIAIFNPRYIHIGHDEVREITRVGSPGPGFAHLFLQDTRRLYDYLKMRGVGTMIWQDTLLQESVLPFIDELPKDIVITSWHYRPARDYPALYQLSEAGFTVLGASWNDPANIAALSQAAHRADIAGMIQTRWTGYFGNRAMFHGQYPQVYAYLTAASRFWNTQAEPPPDAPERLRRAWQGEGQTFPRSGKLVDLTNFSNRTLSDRDGNGWLGRGPDYDLSRMLEQERFAGFQFALGPVVSLQGTHRRVQNDPRRVEVPLSSYASSIAFLHATGWSVPAGTEVGQYIVHFGDGKQETIPIVYGQNITAWTELDVTSIDLMQAWRGETRNGLDAAVTLHLWTNQRAEVPIDRIEFVSAGTIANPMLLGVTLLD